MEGRALPLTADGRKWRNQRAEISSRGLRRLGYMDLGMAMVRAGLAWAFVRYSRDYVQQESEARAAGVGIHSHSCEPAWEWRARQRPNC
jgi:endonuclease YncB( thermonuclease family)